MPGFGQLRFNIKPKTKIAVSKYVRICRFTCKLRHFVVFKADGKSHGEVTEPGESVDANFTEEPLGKSYSKIIQFIIYCMPKK